MRAARQNWCLPNMTDIPNYCRNEFISESAVKAYFHFMLNAQVVKIRLNLIQEHIHPKYRNTFIINI